MTALHLLMFHPVALNLLARRVPKYSVIKNIFLFACDNSSYVLRNFGRPECVFESESTVMVDK